MQYSYQTVIMFDVSGRWQWRVNDCVWPGSQALRWKRKRRKVSRKSPRTDFLQPPVWRLKLNLKLYFLVVFGGRYDKVSESLALRILNIKNIPRNNKDVSWIQYKCGLNVLRVAQDELIFYSDPPLVQIGMIYKTFISICLIPDERSERRAYQTSNTFRCK